MHQRLEAVLKLYGISPGDAVQVEDSKTTTDSITLTRRADGYVFVTLPRVGTELAAPGVQPIEPSAGMLKQLGCSASKPWIGHRNVLLIGTEADRAAAGLGYTVRGWNTGVVRWVSAVDAPTEYGEEHGWRRAPPMCETLIIGQVWPTITRPQVDAVLKLLMSRRGRNTIIAMEEPSDPNKLDPSREALIGQVARDGMVIRGKRAP